MTIFVTSKTFYLAQVLIALLFIFSDCSSINPSSQSIRKLARFLILARMEALFGELPQSLARLAGLAITTTIIISKSVRYCLDLGVFLLLKVIFHWSLAMEITNIALLGHKNKLISYYSFGIDASFNDFLLVIEILISFVKVKPYQ